MLGKDLKVGMMTTFGVVLGVFHEGDYPDGIYEEPHINWMEVQDPHYGTVSSTLQLDDEYEILYEQGTPKYCAVIKRIIEERSSVLKYVQDDISTMLKFI